MTFTALILFTSLQQFFFCGQLAPKDKDVTYLELYEQAIDSIAHNEAIKKGFLFLLDKKKISRRYVRNGIPKFRVSNFIYPIGANDNFVCADSEPSEERWGNVSTDLEKHSVCRKRHKFIVFFSEIYKNQFECTIVNHSGGPPEDNFWIRSRFGRIMTIQFCVKHHAISSCKVNLRTTN
jgi:hypothetical protein